MANKIYLGCRQLDLLLEAVRRYTRFGVRDNKTLENAWTGLGSYSTYKPCVDAGLMTYATLPNPGYSTWWKLTDKGCKIVLAILNRGYDYENVENGWYEKGLHHNNKIAISPHSFFSEKGERAVFNFDTEMFEEDSVLV